MTLSRIFAEDAGVDSAAPVAASSSGALRISSSLNFHA